MEKCTCCKCKTDKKVFDRAVGMIPLCDKCKSTKFEPCKICEEYFYKDDLKSGVCENCASELNGVIRNIAIN